MAARRHTQHEGVHHAPPDAAAPARAEPVTEPPPAPAAPVAAKPEPAPDASTLPTGYVRCRARRTVLVHGIALYEGDLFAMLTQEAKILSARGEVEIVP